MSVECKNATERGTEPDHSLSPIIVFDFDSCGPRLRSRTEAIEARPLVQVFTPFCLTICRHPTTSNLQEPRTMRQEGVFRTRTKHVSTISDSVSRLKSESHGPLLYTEILSPPILFPHHIFCCYITKKLAFKHRESSYIFCPWRPNCLLERVLG